MAQANERKGVLHRLWSDRIAPAISTGEQTFDREDSSERDDPGTAIDEERPAGASNGGDTRERVLTPEERILELVSRRGGRMKQGEIVSNIEWSESTVSRKLQRLESTGDVIRCQFGREKLVYLPGQEPAALASPFAPEEEDVPLPH